MYSPDIVVSRTKHPIKGILYRNVVKSPGNANCRMVRRSPNAAIRNPSGDARGRDCLLTPTLIAAIARPMKTNSDTPFELVLSGRAAEVEALMERLLDGRTRNGEIVRPPRLMQAIRHG